MVTRKTILNNAPPIFLRWQVRVILAVYGTKVDNNSKKHLFNNRAWKKDSDLITEILDGCMSDPPKLRLYMHQLKGGN